MWDDVEWVGGLRCSTVVGRAEDACIVHVGSTVEQKRGSINGLWCCCRMRCARKKEGTD